MPEGKLPKTPLVCKKAKPIERWGSIARVSGRKPYLDRWGSMTELWKKFCPVEMHQCERLDSFVLMGYQAQRERKSNLQQPMRSNRLSAFVEKRKLPRIEVRWPVSVITEKGSVKGEARNISADGVYILFKHPIENLALNETYLLLIDAAGQIVEVMGKPIWFNPDIPPGMGLCFVEISEGDRESLREAIQKSADE